MFTIDINYQQIEMHDKMQFFGLNISSDKQEKRTGPIIHFVPTEQSSEFIKLNLILRQTFIIIIPEKKRPRETT